MSSTIPAALLLLAVAALRAPEVPRAAPGPRAAVEIPEAVLTHPAAGTDPSLQAAPPRWSARALATWGGPWDLRPGLYDHRYITW